MTKVQGIYLDISRFSEPFNAVTALRRLDLDGLVRKMLDSFFEGENIWIFPSFRRLQKLFSIFLSVQSRLTVSMVE